MKTAPKVLNMHVVGGQAVADMRKRGEAVFIGRPSKWGNPFIIGRDGDREACVKNYEAYVFRTPSLLKALPELVGKNLICYCAPRACHGDVLLKLVEQMLAAAPRKCE